MSDHEQTRAATSNADRARRRRLFVAAALAPPRSCACLKAADATSRGLVPLAVHPLTQLLLLARRILALKPVIGPSSLTTDMWMKTHDRTGGQRSCPAFWLLTCSPLRPLASPTSPLQAFSPLSVLRKHSPLMESDVLDAWPPWRIRARDETMRRRHPSRPHDSCLTLTAAPSPPLSRLPTVHQLPVSPGLDSCLCAQACAICARLLGPFRPPHHTAAVSLTPDVFLWASARAGLMLPCRPHIPFNLRMPL